jgi:heptaprenyl diphosphate synthase
MWLLYKKLSRFFSIKGISIGGAIVHSTAQIVVASLILGQAVVMFYLPVLLISSIVTGLITGSIGELAINEVRKKGVFADEK